MKRYNYFAILIVFCLSLITPAFALEKTTGRIAATLGVKIRSGPGTSYDKVITVPYNTIVTIVSYADEGSGCTDKWVEIIYEADSASYKGYVCSTYVEDIKTENVESNDEDNNEGTETTPPTTDTDTNTGTDTDTDTSTDNNTNTGTEDDSEEEDNNESEMANMTVEEFEAYLNTQGFPESYKIKLRALHELHPNWVFVGIKTRNNWQATLANENVSGRSLYQSTSSTTQGYLSTADGHYNWETDTFIANDGSTWFQANVETISYYMDPRNFLTESGIFMFEDLNYHSSYQTSKSVSNILYTDFYTTLIQYYMEAASSYNVSPTYLAALSRQEVGLSSGYATSGTTKDYCSVDYTGYYNFYNIQATSGAKPVCNGLAYAKSVGWDSKQKAIVGGAGWIVNGYINAGQNTPYFQKWNTSINATKPYYHQYMTNIRAVASSAVTTKNSYNSMGIIDYPFVFQIPIYDGIPESTSLPPTGNPNNWLSSLKVNDASVTNFDGEETSYKINVPQGTTSVTVSATPVNSNAKVEGAGVITLSELTTNVNIIVTSQNGNKRTYTLEIIKPEEVVEPEEPKNPEEEDNTGNEGPKEEENNTTEKEEPIVYPTPLETLTKAGYKINSSAYVYNVTLGSTVQGTITKLQAANQYASINITNSSNKAKTSGSLVTGDKITIVSNEISQTYAVVIYGDTNGDGEITTLDLLIVQKHLLKKSTLTNAYLKAADVNKDNSVNTLDLLIIQKHLLKKSNISQS